MKLPQGGNHATCCTVYRIHNPKKLKPRGLGLKVEGLGIEGFGHRV